MSSLWDMVTGRKSSDKKPSSDLAGHSSPAAAPYPTTPSSRSPTSSSGGGYAGSSSSSNSFDPTDGPRGTDDFLRPSSFADPGGLFTLAGLDREAVEYLTLDETALAEGHTVMPTKGFFDDLCYGTGVTYISALGLGGAWGLGEGLRKSAGQPPKLRLNSVLNAVTRRGPFLGNSCGVIALGYNFVNAYIGYLRGKDDAANAVGAGFLTGMAFKSTTGLKPMMISGGIVGSVAAAWAVGRQAFSPVVHAKEAKFA